MLKKGKEGGDRGRVGERQKKRFRRGRKEEIKEKLRRDRERD